MPQTNTVKRCSNCGHINGAHRHWCEDCNSLSLIEVLRGDDRSADNLKVLVRPLVPKKVDYPKS
jgi:hypothetical protein